MEAEVRRRRVGRNLELRYSGHVLPGFPREVGRGRVLRVDQYRSYVTPKSDPIPSPCGMDPGTFNGESLVRMGFALDEKNSHEKVTSFLLLLFKCLN